MLPYVDLELTLASGIITLAKSLHMRYDNSSSYVKVSHASLNKEEEEKVITSLIAVARRIMSFCSL